MNISAADMAVYRRTAKQRVQATRQALHQRYQHACQLVCEAETLLTSQFNISQMKVFGSVAMPNLFHQRSDVDLAVWGLAERDYHRAHARLLSLSAEISVDLVRFEEASASLQQTIINEGRAAHEFKTSCSGGPN